MIRTKAWKNRLSLVLSDRRQRLHGLADRARARRARLRGQTALVVRGPQKTRTRTGSTSSNRHLFDLLDRDALCSALRGGELLVHNAGVSTALERDPNLIYRVNVEGTQHVLDAAAEHGDPKIVYTSSTATPMPSINREIETEESLFDLRSFQGHYKVSKVTAEIGAIRRAAQGLPAVVAHPTTATAGATAARCRPAR